MTDNSSNQGTNWPTPKFSFEVDLGNGINGIFFQEISGLDTEAQLLEYRAGNSKAFSDIKMPGIKKYANITMKRGIFINDDTFRQWNQNIKTNTLQRSTVVIKLLDESGAVTMQWTLSNAWPTKITVTDLKSDGSEIAVDTIEIAHEKLEIKNT